MKEAERFVVIVRVSAAEGDEMFSRRRRSRYVLATRQVFQTYAEADTYAKTCAASRKPLVVGGRWFSMRHASALPPSGNG